MLGRASHLERVSRWLARREQELQVRLARELVSDCRSLNRAITELDQGARAAGQRDRTRTARAARLRRGHRRETARRDRPDRPLQERRPTRPPQRRRPARSKLRPHPAPPPRPRRQPPTQRRALPDRDHPGPLPPRRPRLPRTQTSRRKTEAIRCLKRLLVRVVFNTLKASPALTCGEVVHESGRTSRPEMRLHGKDDPLDATRVRGKQPAGQDPLNGFRLPARCRRRPHRSV